MTKVYIAWNAGDAEASWEASSDLNELKIGGYTHYIEVVIPDDSIKTNLPKKVATFQVSPQTKAKK